MSQVQTHEQVVLLSPTAEHGGKAAPLAPRRPSLRGATVAVINAFNDPERSNAELHVRHVADVLLRSGAAQVVPLRKTPSTEDMSEELVSYVSSQAQAAVILEGD